MSSTLLIVIVNWNSGAQLRDCVKSIEHAAAALPPGRQLTELIVVDNASTDGSECGLQLSACPLTLISNSVNRGFAAACNQGAAIRATDWILFLNPDTLLFEESLAVPLAHLDEPEHRHTGIAGVQLVDDSGQVWRSCSRFPTLRHFAAQALGIDRIWPRLGQAMRDWDHGQTRQVDQVIGAFFLVRREVFNAIGGFDERFFVYFEEVDMALRAKQAGWFSMYFADARAFHKGGGTTDQVRSRRLFYSLRSRLLYGRKHFRRPQQSALAFLTWAIEPLSRALHLLVRGRWRQMAYLFEAYVLLARRRPPA